MQTTNPHSLAAMLEEQINRSDAFTKENFGLELGAEYPEIAREIFRSRAVCKKIFAGWLISQFANEKVVKALQGSSGPDRVVKEVPEIYKLPLSFLYWGIQLGRELQRSQDAVLQDLSERQ